MKNSTLYSRWIAANAVGELFGLGLTFAIGYAIIALFGELPGVTGSLVSMLLMVATGAVEGAIVGWTQWWAMAPVYTAITRRAWVLATIAGALVAWLFGSLPFIIINSAVTTVEGQPGAAAAEPEQWMVLLMAAGVGLIAGAVLAAFQALVLRRAVGGAGWWLLANALAWAAGMPVIFAAMDVVFSSIPVYLAVVVFALTLLLTGAVVGAVHGLFLVWLRSRLVNV